MMGNKREIMETFLLSYAQHKLEWLCLDYSLQYPLLYVSRDLQLEQSVYTYFGVKETNDCKGIESDPFK